MPSVLDSVSVDDVFETSLSNGDRTIIVVTDTNSTVSTPFITGYVAQADPIRTDDEDAIFVPNDRTRLRVSGKKVTVFVDHIVMARHYGTLSGFGEYDLAPDLPDAVASKAADAINRT